MRYAITLIVVALIFGAGVAFVQQTNRSIENRSRQAMREAKAAGKLPPEIDPEANFGVELSPADARQLKLAHFLVAWRFVLIAILVLGGLGIARMVKRGSH